MNLRRCCRKWLQHDLSCYPRICVQELGKTTTYLRHAVCSVTVLESRTSQVRNRPRNSSACFVTRYLQVGLTLLQATKVLRRVEVQLLLFFDLGTRKAWVVNATPRPTLPPGKTRCPLYSRLGVPQDQSGQVQKISPPPGFDTRTFQPVTSRNTVYAIPPRYEIFPTAGNQPGRSDTQCHLRCVSASSTECSTVLLPLWFPLRCNSIRFVPQHGCGSTAYKLRLPVYNSGLHVSLYSMLPLTPLARYFASHLSPKVRTVYRQVCEGLATRRLLPDSCFF